MGRAAFGGAQDLSQVFAALFSQYENRLQDLALRAENRAQAEQSAADADMLDRWDKHDISDKELIRYLNHRIREERTNPEQQEYLKQQLRAAQEAIQERGYSNVLGRITYGFQSGKLSGGSAGAQLRAFAEQFRHSDPDRYWSLLQTALQMEQAGAAGSGSGGGGGSSSGGGAGLADTIDQLKGFKSRLRSLADQFYAGNKTGEITTYDRNGNLHTETFMLSNPDGTPSRDLIALHNQTLNVYDQLEHALLADGKAGEAGSIANERADFIVQRVQPANTIRPENQYNRLLSGFIDTVRAADNNPDPDAAARNIRAAAARLQAWHNTLNARKVADVGPEDLPGYKGMKSSANDKSVLYGVGVRKQTTGAFVDLTGKQIAAIMVAANSDDPDEIRKALGALDISDPTQESIVTELRGAGDALAQIAIVRRGLVDGTWQYAMHPQFGVIPVQVDRQTTGIGPDGQPIVRPVPIMYDKTGKEIDLKDAQVVPVIAKVNGQYQPILGVAQSQTVATSAFEWNGTTYHRGEEIPKEVLDAISKSNQASSLPVGEMRVVSTPEGQWYGLPGAGGEFQWYKGSVAPSGTPGAAMPYIGRPENVQSAADKFGLDPNHTILSNAYETGLAATPATVQRNTLRAERASDFLHPSDEDSFLTRIQNTAAALGIGNRANKMARDLGTPRMSVPAFNMPKINAPTINPVSIRPFSLNVPNFQTISPEFSPNLPRDAASQQAYIRRRTGGF